MIYSEAERKEIERVYGVFKDYIHASKFLDFVWSEKLGYLLLHIDPTKNTIEEDQIIAMSVPTIMIIMPLYSLAVQWGIKGRVLLVVLYIMLRVPYTAIYLLDFFSSLSRSYEEAAYIDGCSHSRTFWQIMLPLVQPAIITVTIFNFMSVWNEFFMALIFTTSDSMTPVGVGLLQIVNAMKYSGQYGAMFAAVIIVFLPTFLLYLFLSEKIIVGATSGGVKG